jgi:hypothetical protein
MRVGMTRIIEQLRDPKTASRAVRSLLRTKAQLDRKKAYQVAFLDRPVLMVVQSLRCILTRWNILEGLNFTPTLFFRATENVSAVKTKRSSQLTSGKVAQNGGRE